MYTSLYIYTSIYTGLKLTVKPSGKRWSLNICPPDHKDVTDVYCHFNPRYVE